MPAPHQKVVGHGPVLGHANYSCMHRAERAPCYKLTDTRCDTRSTDTCASYSPPRGPERLMGREPSSATAAHGKREISGNDWTTVNAAIVQW